MATYPQPNQLSSIGAKVSKGSYKTKEALSQTTVISIIVDRTTDDNYSLTAQSKSEQR